MAQGNRPDRVGEEIRQELATLLSREVHDPGIGFITLTRVKVSPDLQLARVFYTMMGDARQHKETEKALTRALPFLRRQIGARIRLRRVPELRFEFDRSVENQDRIEKILIDLQAERDALAAAANPPDQPDQPDPSDQPDQPDPSDQQAPSDPKDPS